MESAAPAGTSESTEPATTDDLKDLEDVEFLLEEIEDQIAPLARPSAA